MADDDLGTKRRVYDLPIELVERIEEFQKERGIRSEVEAARRLLDQALKSRDTIEAIVGRYLTAFSMIGDSAEAAKQTLVGHPLVPEIRFANEAVEGFKFVRHGEFVRWVWPISRDHVVISDNEMGGGPTFTYVATREKDARLLDSNNRNIRGEEVIPF